MPPKRHFLKWSRQESNLYLEFRKRLFYPLNYGTNKRAAKLGNSIHKSETLRNLSI